MNMQLTQFIKTLLTKSGLSERHVNQMQSTDNMEIFKCAFTSPDTAPDANYEWLEQIGDVLHTSFIVNYFYSRFPYLRTQQGVKIVARLRIKYVGRKALAALADKLGFWDHVVASAFARCRDKEKLLEDVFEAFIGAVKICGDNVKPDFGNVVISRMLTHIYDDEKMEISWENLVDAKTRLKEFCDTHPDLHIKILHETSGTSKYEARVVLKDSVLGTGTSHRLVDAEQAAAEIALKTLARKGYTLIDPTKGWGKAFAQVDLYATHV